MIATELTLDLGPTRTYAERRATWLPLPGGGLLTLVLAKTVGGKVRESRYFVEVDPCEVPGVKRFLLLKPDGTVYGVEVTPAGVSCTCRAGLVRAFGCKHAAGVAALDAAGANWAGVRRACAPSPWGGGVAVGA